MPTKSATATASAISKPPSMNRRKKDFGFSMRFDLPACGPAADLLRTCCGFAAPLPILAWLRDGCITLIQVKFIGRTLRKIFML
jgi:hypothetical protein